MDKTEEFMDSLQTAVIMLKMVQRLCQDVDPSIFSDASNKVNMKVFLFQEEMRQAIKVTQDLCKQARTVA